MREPDLLARITVDPEQCGGRACIRGMRLRVIDVLELLAAGETPEEILEEFPYLESDDIRASLVYAACKLDHGINPQDFQVVAATHESNTILEGTRLAATAGREALRTALLINGGGAVALLAFLGSQAATSAANTVAPLFAKPLLFFVLGLLCAGLCSTFIYFVQWADVSGRQPFGRWLNYVAIILGLASFACFAVGSWAAYSTFSEYPSTRLVP